MKKRLVIYFHYDSRGQVDSACRFAVSALTEQAELFFVTNGTLQPGSRIWVQGHCARLLERQNTGFDVVPTGRLCSPWGARGWTGTMK